LLDFRHPLYNIVLFCRLKSAHADHMAKAAVELQQKAQRGVSQGVARCLGERAALQGELAHLAEQNQALVQENQTFRDTETLLRRKDQVLEPLIRELSHSKQSNLRVRDTDRETDGMRERERGGECIEMLTFAPNTVRNPTRKSKQRVKTAPIPAHTNSFTLDTALP